MSESDWAKTLAANFQKLLSERASKEAKFVAEQQVRSEFIGRLWLEIRAAVHARVSALNEELKTEVVSVDSHYPHTTVSLRRNQPTAATITVECDLTSCAIRARGSGALERYEQCHTLNINGENGKGHLTFEDGTTKEPAQIAEKMLEALLTTGV